MSTAIRPPLLWFSPLPPARNGIADYAAVLLLRLNRFYQCICVVEDPAQIDPRIASAVRILSYDDYLASFDGLSAERHLCHLGNNADSVPIIDVMSRVPMVAVVHDLSLHYLMELWAEARLGDRAGIRDVCDLLHGGAADELARAKFDRGVPLQSIYFEFPCLPLLDGGARAVITHSQYGRVAVAAAGYEGPNVVIPHFALPLAPERRRNDRARWRGRLGIGSGTVLFASLGFVSPKKRIAVTLQALAALPAGTDWHFVIAGEDQDPTVRQTCKALGLADRVTILDYVGDSEFDGLLSASDVLVNLRFPTAGETSGTVCRALAAGLPCLVSDHGWYAELPHETTYRVTPDARPAALSRTLAQIVEDGPGRLRKSQAAADYARRVLDPDRVVAAYRAAIEAGQAQVRPASGPAALSEHVTLPVPRLPALEASAEAGARLLERMRDEQASIDGRALPALALPGAADLAPLAGPAPEDPQAGPRQAFLAIGGETLAEIGASIDDARQRLAPGDLLTAAILSDRPDPVRPAGRTFDERPDPDLVWPLEDRLTQVLRRAGFDILRAEDMALPATRGSEGYGRIVLATARLIRARRE